MTAARDNPTRPGKPPARASATKPATTRAAAVAKIVAYVRKNPGTCTRVLRDRVGLSDDDVWGVAIRQAVTEKLVWREGIGFHTRYFPAGWVKPTPKKPRASPPPYLTAAEIRSEPFNAPIPVILRYVREHPGTTGEEFRKALKMPMARWSIHVESAVAAQMLRKEGQGRASRYWAV